MFACTQCAWEGLYPGQHEWSFHDGAQTCWTEAEWQAAERLAVDL